MITNPSCQSDAKDPEQKFQAPNFDEEIGDMGGGGQGGCTGGQPSQVTELAGYGHPHMMAHHAQYNGHYNPYGQQQWQQDYGYYGGHPGQYGGPPAAGHQYQGMYHHEQQQQQQQQQQWGGHQGMVQPPGPSPTGSNNSPSPHTFSDSNEEHGPLRGDLKRPSPDTFVPGAPAVLGPQSPLQPPVAKKPKVSKRRKKRDPNEPQKPVSAYALFFRDTQASIKMRNPNANFGEVSKIVAATWDALDPESKAAYKKRTEMAKKEYLRALAAYRASLVSKVSGPNAVCNAILYIMHCCRCGKTCHMLSSSPRAA